MSFALAVGVLALAGALPGGAATLTVTNTNDSGLGSLRNAIATASSGDTIQFAPGVTGTITLTSGELLIDKNLTITGPGAAQLAVSGNNSSRVFEIGNTATVAISGLTIENGRSSQAAGILNNGTLTLTNSTVSGNTVTISAGGGGILNEGTLTLTNSTVSGNTAGYGGGLFNSGGTFTLTNSTVSGNTAGNGSGYGGGIYNLGSGTITNSTVSGNTAASTGGGIENYTSSGTLTLINSTVSGNSATNGGGLYNSPGGTLTGGTLTLINSTVSGNSATNGGGLYNSPGGTPIVKSTLLANNGSGGNCAFAGGTATSLGYNLSDDTTCASFFTQPTDLNNVGAGLDPKGLQNNGGPTQTIALLPASPAVDHIPVANCTDLGGNPITTDQRGIARPQGPACDVGAFELVENAPSISKSFGASLIPFNGTTSLSFTVKAPASNNVTGVNFTDTLPGGLVVASPNGLTGSCGGGTITATAGSSAVSLSGASLSAGVSCTFAVNVTGTSPGGKNNSVAVSSDQGAGNTGTASLTVAPPASVPPTLAKSFDPANVQVGQNSVLSFTVTNPNASAALSGIAFNDTLPPGLVVATPNGLSGSCGGTVSALAGSNTVSLTGGTLAGGASCTFSVVVTALATGPLPNTTGTITATESGPGLTASATLTVSTDAYQVNYASNLQIGDGVINISNNGASAGANTPLVNGNSYGDLCVNAYVYAPDQELAACCTCLVSPDSLHSWPVSFGPGNLLQYVNNGSVLASINQTHSVVIKLLATPAQGDLASAGGAVCPGPATPGTGVTTLGGITGLGTGVVAWSTHAHPTNTTQAAITETPFVPATLSMGELGKLTGDCRAFLTTGSGQVCPGCRTGGLAVPAALTPQLP